MDEKSLSSFIKEVCGESRLRIEEDLGDGFVRLNSSEAELRQAAQDIRSSEDIVIELLRNSRDAGARRIFLGLQRDGQLRNFVVIDDGSGIPSHLLTRIFEPRVTSKLDTAHMDKWGMHGRGMALFSISQNAVDARVLDSVLGGGTSISVTTDLSKLSEKKDQSTFPRFELVDGSYAMRGPKNIVRTACEFSLEHKGSVNVFCGTFTEIAATIYEIACAAVAPAMRAFGTFDNSCPIVHRLAYATDPAEFARICEKIGLVMSERSARRILDGQIKGLPTLYERLKSEFAPKDISRSADHRKPAHKRLPVARIDDESVDAVKQAVSSAFTDVALKYYLRPDVEPAVSVRGDELVVRIPLVKCEE